jgi:hypothetical protein
MAKKRRAAKKKAGKKTAKKRGARKAKRKVHRPEPGYRRRHGTGIFVPTSYDDGKVVKPSRISQGIAEAQAQMREMFYRFSEALATTSK